MSRFKSMKALCTAALILPLAIEAQANGKDPLPRVDPTTVGLSPERLERIGAALKREIEAQRLPGAVVAIARRGKLAYFESFGALDPDTKAPMRPDAIFSIASMTKPMVSAGIMILHEEGRLSIADPVGKYLPQMAKMQVASDFKTDVSGNVTVDTKPAGRQPTIQDLLRHTSGVPYGARGNTPVHKMWPPSSSGAATGYTSEEFIEKIGKLPLLHEPGTVWEYSLSTDILGLVIEAVSGKRLGDFLSERIWQPLGMVDTGFAVPDDKKDRYARPFPNDPVTGKPQSVLHDRSKPLKFECGGGCVASTAHDYIRFSQMLLSGGVLDGKRILGKHTVAYMTFDHLGPEIENNVAALDASRLGYGFGLGFAVRRQDGISGVAGTKGDYNWGGAYGTYFWNDPMQELTVVYMAHTPGPIRTQYRRLMHALVLQAIVE